MGPSGSGRGAADAPGWSYLAVSRTISQVPVHVFFNPELVEQLAARGITRRSGLSAASPRGFVLAGRAQRAHGGRAVTHVINTHEHVIITGQRRLPVGRPAATIVTATEPLTAIELAEECARLRRDNQRLSTEVAQLREEVTRLTSPQVPRQRAAIVLDDAAQRFSLLELK